MQGGDVKEVKITGLVQYYLMIDLDKNNEAF